MKYKRARFLIVITLVVSMIASSMIVSFAASDSKTKKMTTYGEVIKSGKYAYCSTGKGIIRVNLKNNSVKRIVKTNFAGMNPMEMKLYKGYIYYCLGDGVVNGLYRVKINGKNKKNVGSVQDYAISGKTIFYTTRDYDYDTEEELILHEKMSLTGKNNSSTSYVVSMKSKRSNAKGYRIKHVEKANGKCVDYLVKPNNKKVKLCSYAAMW